MPLSGSIERLAYDVRHALRALWSARGTALVLVITLAIGIGANTAVFTIADALLTRPLPVRDPSSLYSVTLDDFCSWGWVERDRTMNYALWTELRASHSAFSRLFAYGPTLFDVSTTGEVRLVAGAYASSEMWSVLGVHPIVGRAFGPEAERGGAESAVALIGERFWESEYGRDPAILGRRLTLGRRPVAIVGVVPRHFGGMYVGVRAEIYVPVEAAGWITTPSDPRAPFDPQHWWLVVAGRLRPDVPVESARRSLAAWSPLAMRKTIPADWPADRPALYLNQRFAAAPVATGFSYVRDSISEAVVVASALVALLLLLACVNVATIQLGRGLTRRRDYAVRLAVGASRARLAWQVLLECSLAAGAGASLGVVLAFPSTHALARLYDTRFDSLQLDLAPDGRMLALAATLACVTAVTFGVAPALQAMRTDGQGVLRSVRGAGATDPVGRWLVALQVAIAVVLGTMALFFGATLRELVAQPTGLATKGLVVVEIDTERAELATGDRRAFYRFLLDRLSGLPQVSEVAASYVAPLGGRSWQSNIRVDDVTGSRDVHSFFHVVTPGFLETYGTRVIAGRPFTAGDALGAAQVVLVNRTFAESVLGGRPFESVRVRGPLGNMRVDAAVVGVVEDAKYRSLRSGAPATVYVPLLQDPAPPTNLAVTLRPRAPLPETLSAVRTSLDGIGPKVSYEVQPFDTLVADSVVSERAMAAISGLFGGLAMLLAAVGIYGLTAYAVRQRRSEIGIRLALGASPSRILRLLALDMGRPLALGTAAGLIMAFWGAHLAAARLYAVTPSTPRVYLSSIGLLLLAAVVAVAAPTRQVTRVDPAEALRAE